MSAVSVRPPPTRVVPASDIWEGGMERKDNGMGCNAEWERETRGWVCRGWGGVGWGGGVSGPTGVSCLRGAPAVAERRGRKGRHISFWGIFLCRQHARARGAGTAGGWEGVSSASVGLIVSDFAVFEGWSVVVRRVGGDVWEAF